MTNKQYCTMCMAANVTVYMYTHVVIKLYMLTIVLFGCVYMLTCTCVSTNGK